MKIDDKLIQSCIKKDRAAQKQLYELLLPYLRAVANRYLRDTSYSKDILQESFVKIFQKIDKYDSKKASIQHWAARIIINNCLNYNDRVIGIPNLQINISHHETLSTRDSIKKYSDEHLLYILKKMPDDYLKVFNLFAIDGYSHKEIASILSISENLSRKRLSRSRSWLKKTFHLKAEILSSLQILTNSLN